MRQEQPGILRFLLPRAKAASLLSACLPPENPKPVFCPHPTLPFPSLLWCHRPAQYFLLQWHFLGGVDTAPGRCAGSQAAESRLRGVSGSLWSRCESRREACLSVPDSSSEKLGRRPGKSTLGLCFASLPPNQTTGAVSLEVNVKVYLNPCAGVHSSPNYKDL